jgi:hypothetical protein
MGTMGILSFALGGGVIIFALVISFSGGPGILFGPVLGFFGFLGLGVGLSDIFTAGTEPRRPQRPLGTLSKIGILVMGLGLATLFTLPLAVGIFFQRFTFVLPIVLLVVGAVLIAMGEREHKAEISDTRR